MELFPHPYQVRILVALGLKPAGSVYAGTAHDRPARRRLEAARARRKAARLDSIAARAAYAQAHNAPASRGAA